MAFFVYEARVVQKIFTMRDEGTGFYNIARALNEQGIPTKAGSKWQAFTIKRLLTNPAYIGLTYFGRTSGSRKTQVVNKDKKDWKLLSDATPPIISEDLFHRVQEKIKQSRDACCYSAS